MTTVYFIQYFVLLCLSIVMIVNAVGHFYTNKRISICSILITLACIILSLTCYFNVIAKVKGLYYTALTLSIIGYTLRPVCIYLFILMNKRAYRGKYSFLIWIPLVINLIIFLCAYIPGTKDVIFGYSKDASGTLSFSGGPLRFTSHIISFLYLSYLIYISIFTLKIKHFQHGITILTCAAFVTIAVIIETFDNGEGNIELLNTTIMVSTLTYYLFLYKEHMQIDSLTGLFNRETYYRDLAKMTKTITAIIQFDINGLKFLNDNYGHHEGDKCISTVANLIATCEKRSMYAYRMGGDEFLVIVNNEKEEAVIEMIKTFKEKLVRTNYECSVGYAYKNDKQTSIEDLIKEAEKNMYLDKSNFYKETGIERRKS